MPMGTLEKSRTLSDQAMDMLVEAILRGDMEPGERIAEATLARKLGISRGPLREAIRRLEGKSLLVRKPHVGVSVASPSPEEILEVFQMREVLEGLACRMAARHMTGIELDRLERILGDHSTHSDLQDGRAYYQSSGDFDFHYQIIVASRSKRLIDTLLGDLYQFIRIFRYRASAKPGRAQKAFGEHMLILEALKARDQAAAEAAMRAHVARATETLRASLQEQGNSRDDLRASA
jgi:DNA-binding GntR family transcriptional regulator